MGQLGIGHWLIVAGVVVLIFSTRNGSLGDGIESAVRNFRTAMNTIPVKVVVALILLLCLLVVAGALAAGWRGGI